MNFLQKLRFLFSRSDDFSWLTDLDYRDRLTQRVLQLVEAQPAAEWIAETCSNMSTSIADEKPTITILQVYAELAKAIASGHGDRVLGVEVAYQAGLLCGTPRVLISGLVLQPPRPAFASDPYLCLQTNRSVVMLDRETVRTTLKLEDLKGPMT